MLKESRMMFEEFKNKTIKDLRDQLKVLKQRGCVPNSKVHLAEASIANMEHQAKHWVNIIVAQTKFLVDQQLDLLSDLLKKTCDTINLQKIRAKGMLK